MAVTIIANGHLGTLKQQRVSTNTTTTKLSDILNNANIIPPVTNEPNKVFSYWATTISGFDIGDYTISQLYSIGAITPDNILNIYANFTYVANAIQITFNTNGGAFSDGSTTKVVSTSVGSIYGELESSVSVLPTKSGSYFWKWTDPSGSIVNGAYEFTDSVVITAQWTSSQNTSITAKDSRGKSVISGLFPKLTLWKDLYAKAVSNGYTPDDTTKPFSKILPGYGSYTGQAVKKIDFSVANNPMLIGWLRGSIYDAGGYDTSLYTNRNLVLGTSNSITLTTGNEGWGAGSIGNVSSAYGQNNQLAISFIIDLVNVTSIPKFRFNFTNDWGSDGVTLPGCSLYSLDPVWTVKKISDTKYYMAAPFLVDFSTNGIPGNIEVVIDPNNDNASFTLSYVKVESGTEPTDWTPAPEDVRKKIRDFSSTNIPVDPSTTFSVTGKGSAALALTHNAIGQDEYWTNRNLIPLSQTLNFGIGNNTATTSTKLDYDSTTKMIHITSPKGGSTNAGLYFSQPGTNDATTITKGDTWTFGLDIKGTGRYSQMGIEGSNPFNKLSGEVPSEWTRVYTTGTAAGSKNAVIIYFDSSTEALDIYIKLPSLSKGNTVGSDWTPAMEDIKPGLWLNDDWLYNPYTQKWLDSSLDRTDFTYSNAVITFKDYFNVQYVTGDISKVRSSVVATVKSVVAGYGSTTDKHSLYNNSYFPSDDSGITLNVEEYLGYSYINFFNPNTGYSQKIYKAAGTAYSEYLKGITKSKFETAGKYLKGFYVSNYWSSAKLIASNPISAPIDMAKSDYIIQKQSSFTTVFFDANNGVFYKGTSYETSVISVDVATTDTYGVVAGYVPPVTKRTMGLLYWALDLDSLEPAYPKTVVNNSTVFAKWSVIDDIELYRKPREFYLVDASSIIRGWDLMDKFSLSDKNNIFVIDPEGNGTTYDTSSTYTSYGWGSAEQEIEKGTLSFDAYYNGYSQYNRLGRWMRGKELAMVRLDETGKPTYWMVKPAEIERTEIKFNEQYLKGKLSFTKLSPAFDLEFLGIGTDNTIENADDMFRRNAYVYIHSLQIPGADTGVQIIAHNGSETVEDAVSVDLPAGSYFEYSTIPFKERWRYGPSWSDMPNNLYNNIVNLAVARPIVLGIGRWELSVSSSTIVTIDSLKPHKIQDYAGKTIDSLGGLGPFTGIAIKEKEL